MEKEKEREIERDLWENM